MNTLSSTCAPPKTSSATTSLIFFWPTMSPNFGSTASDPPEARFRACRSSDVGMVLQETCHVAIGVIGPYNGPLHAAITPLIIGPFAFAMEPCHRPPRLQSFAWVLQIVFQPSLESSALAFVRRAIAFFDQAWRAVPADFNTLFRERLAACHPENSAWRELGTRTENLRIRHKSYTGSPPV